MLSLFVFTATTTAVQRNIFFEELEVPQNDREHQVDDDRDPCRLPLARARQIVLQLDEQVRYARSKSRSAVSQSRCRIALVVLAGAFQAGLPDPEMEFA